VTPATGNDCLSVALSHFVLLSLFVAVAVAVVGGFVAHAAALAGHTEMAEHTEASFAAQNTCFAFVVVSCGSGIGVEGEKHCFP